MEFKYHGLTGILIPGVLYFFFDIPLIAAVTIALASILIDVDHYFWYVIKKKDLSLTKTFPYYENIAYLIRNNKVIPDGVLLHIFHVFEFC